MTFRSDFVSSPETFMQLNIVTPQFRDGGRVPQESRPIVVTIKEWAGKRCSKRGGKVYHLSQDVSGLSRAEKLPIYWLAYKDKDFTLGTLNGQSQYMFTALMNGCTLGFGSQTGDGACLVSHANARQAGGGIAQRDAQRTQLATRFDGGSFDMIEPADYRATTHGDANFQATNFGRNVNGTWQFFTHKFMESGGTGGVILHGGVSPSRTMRA